MVTKKGEIDGATLAKLLKAQQGEITEHLIYKRLSASEKDAGNRRILSQISRDELGHYALWKSYTGRDVGPSRWKVWLYLCFARLFGITFSIKLMERGEGDAQQYYREIAPSLPAAGSVALDEDRHEAELIALIDEERLRYIGAIIRGLNEALIELSAALVGLTLALHDARFIALTGLITGIAMSFSLGATEYLASKSEGHAHPVRAAAYTSVANLLTVLFLVFPYLVFDSYYAALGLMLCNAALVIIIFNYHISVAKGLSFRKSFAEMLLLFLGVAAVTFLIGYLARLLFHIELH